MSAAVAQPAQFAFEIEYISIYSGVAPKEVATAPEGIVTESFGPTQVALYHVYGKTPLIPGDAYEIRASRPYDFAARNMRYIGKLESGASLFRAPVT